MSLYQHCGQQRYLSSMRNRIARLRSCWLNAFAIRVQFLHPTLVENSEKTRSMRGTISMSGLKVNLRVIPFFAFAFVLAPPAWSQQPSAAESPAAKQPATPQPQSYSAHDYSKSVKPFPNVLAPYKSRSVPEADLANRPRIDQLMRDGKLYLSMDDAIALALENDLELARYNLNIADTDILRARAGSNILGVNIGVIQNTPGGGVGGLSGTVGSGTGGTSVVAGGAGTGTSGIVSSTLGIGPTIQSFDPTLSGTFEMNRDYTLSSSALSGKAVTNTNTGTANISYQQGFHTGTTLLVGFNNSHVTTDNPLSALSPTINSNFQFRVTQE